MLEFVRLLRELDRLIGRAAGTMSRYRFLVLGVLLALATAGLISVAQAQSSPAVHVHAVEPPQSVVPETGGLPGLLLRVTFSLLDADGIVMKSDIENATLRLGGDVYSSKFSKLEDEWSVVLLMDTSGTLSTGRAFNDFRTIRDGLTRSLESAPDGTRFALIPFSDRAPTAVEFTSNGEQLTNALKGLRPQYGKPACLNDALYEAIAKLSSAPGRRAVIALTASADSCATRSAQNVVDFATENQVEIYAVGVEGYTITEQELDSLTLPAGGFSETRSVNEFGFALDNLMATLANQWQAVWVVYPTEGPQTAEISVKLPDSTVLTGPVAFESDRSYDRPPSVAVAGTAQSTLGGVRFNLDIINPERIGAIDVNLISNLTGRSIHQEQITEVTDSILIPADNLVEDGEYSLVLTAFDDQGIVLSQTAPVDFSYTPLEPRLTATVQEWPTAATPFFVISVAIQNLDGVANYRLWMEEGQGSPPIRGTEVTIPAGETIQVPVGGVRSGSFVVRVQALDRSDRVLIESTELKVDYRAPGLLTRLVATLQGSGFAVLGVCMLGFVAATGLGVVVWFVIPRGRGVRNVELMMPEKARRQLRAAEPAPPPVASPPPGRPSEPPAPATRQRAHPQSAPPSPAPVPPQARVQPAGGESARPQPPRPAPPTPEPAPEQPPRPAPEPLPPVATPRAAVPPHAGPLARVRIAEPRIAAFEAEIHKSPFRIGRASDNDGVLPVAATSGVSGHHCVIHFANGRWTIQDEQSKYGTTVDGQPIPKGQPFELHDGAVVGLGPKLRIQFHIVAGSNPNTPS